MTSLLEKVADGIDRVSRTTGSLVRWLTLLTVILCLLVALLRYTLSIGFVWMQELYVWSHAAVFMLAASYTYLLDGHVRVDIFHGRLSARGQAVVEIIGILMLLFPWLAVLAYISFPYIVKSWRIAEASAQYGGLPGLFLLKTVLILFAMLLFLQGVAVILRNTLFLAGKADRPAPQKPEIAEAGTADGL